MRSKELKKLSIVELRRLAREVKVSPKRTMTKEQLIKAIVRAARSRAISKALRNKKQGNKKPSSKAQAIKTYTTPIHVKQQVEERLPVYKGITKLVLMPRDPWWVFAYWEVDKTIVSDKPLILKLYRQYDKLYSSINIGSADNWYINLPEPSDIIRAELGYVKPGGEFVILAISNTVKTPRAWPSNISYTGEQIAAEEQQGTPFMDAYTSYERTNPYIREAITSRKR
jgi:hypothetical protein